MSPSHHVASTTHPTNRPASQHVTCVRRGGKGTSQRRETQSSGLALPSTRPSAGSAARANTYILIISSVRCGSPRHVQPANRRPHPPSHQVASNTTNRSSNIPACHTHGVRWWRKGELERDIVMTTSLRPIKPKCWRCWRCRCKRLDDIQNIRSLYTNQST